MTIILTAIKPTLYDSWQQHCCDLEDVEIYKGSILDVQADAIVSPANSFGFMDGGVDMVYLRKFGLSVQERLQLAIREHWDGELPVGCAEVISTEATGNHPYLIAAPTMRVPMLLPHDTPNPYLAARAALLRAWSYPSIKRIAFPGMGTGVGCVTSERCAIQVRQAILAATGQAKFPDNFKQAQLQHGRLVDWPEVASPETQPTRARK